MLSLLDGPEGSDLGLCVVWFCFRIMRRHLAYHSDHVQRILSRNMISSDGVPGAWACPLAVAECC